jgi:uncharacterized membrane protein YhaH (DUF805 family)
MEWYFKAIGSNYANFNGRATRQEYWMFALFDLLIIVFLFMIDDSTVLYTIYTIALIIPRYALLVRRLHDINKSGWFTLVGIIPVVGWLILLVFASFESYPNENEYGENIESLKNEELINNIASILSEEETVKEEDILEPLVAFDEIPVKALEKELESINLNVISGTKTGSFYSVHSRSRIGRAPDNDIVLNENTVSSYHAEIKIQNNNFIIMDLNSTNGTKVDGNKIKEEIIKSGSTLRIGEINLLVE